jgi:adenine-specific DNA-methyltransferase
VLNRHYIGNHKELEFKGLKEEVSDLSTAKKADYRQIVCEYLENLP